jgi:hypothetical protein
VRLYGDHPDAAVYDTLEGHQALLERLSDEFPDGWAYSLNANTLQRILPLCPDDVRIAAWVKGWCSWKRNVYPAYAWEPVIFRGGRKPGTDRTWETARDWMQCNVTTGEPVKGAKPQAFCRWVFALLGAQREDEFVDLFPGSGAVSRAWDKWCQQFDFEVGA